MLTSPQYSGGGTDAVVFLIDCGSTMRHADATGAIPIKEALTVVSEWLQSKVISSPKDFTAVCFYNTVDI
jgi:hypothetical protein